LWKDYTLWTFSTYHAMKWKVDNRSNMGRHERLSEVKLTHYPHK